MLVGTPEGKISLPRHRWKDKVNVSSGNEIGGCELDLSGTG
jgi:hypothetical protein